jgi:hypothetical protein
LQLPADRVLDALSGRMTAARVAERLGYPRTAVGPCTATAVVPVLKELHSEGRVGREVRADDEGNRPTAYWIRVG